MNYYALKALFALEELEKIDRQLALTLRHGKDKRRLGLLMMEHDRLAEEARQFNAIALNRLRKEHQ